VSLVEQYTIDCEYLAYFLPKKNSEKNKNYKRDIMQLFSADATMFFKKFQYFFAHANMKKLASKVAHNRPIFFFSIANRLKISPNLIFSSIKMTACATSI
jgi:hypothetical protein